MKKHSQTKTEGRRQRPPCFLLGHVLWVTYGLRVPDRDGLPGCTCACEVVVGEGSRSNAWAEWEATKVRRGFSGDDAGLAPAERGKTGKRTGVLPLDEDPDEDRSREGTVRTCVP